jgi:hypothetical protein
MGSTSTINGKRTVELDYSTLHPRLLYGIEGRPMPVEPYDIGLNQKYRDLIKHAFNAIINASSGRVDEPEGYDQEAVGISWNELMERVKQVHEPIAKYFNTGHGVKLQYTDSCIAEAVMLHFAQQDVPCLPLHDSFLMYHGYERELEYVMQKEFHQLTGGDAKIKPTLTAILGRGQNIRMIMNGVLVPNLPDAYKGYVQRLTDWVHRDH